MVANNNGTFALHISVQFSSRLAVLGTVSVRLSVRHTLVLSQTNDRTVTQFVATGYIRGTLVLFTLRSRGNSLAMTSNKTHHQSELVGDVAVPVSVRQAVLF